MSTLRPHKTSRIISTKMAPFICDLLNVIGSVSMPLSARHRVVVFDDLVVFDAHFCHSVGAVLAHADAVAPAAACEGVAGDVDARVAFVITNKLLFSVAVPSGSCRP